MLTYVAVVSTYEAELINRQTSREGGGGGGGWGGGGGGWEAHGGQSILSSVSFTVHIDFSPLSLSLKD